MKYFLFDKTFDERINEFIGFYNENQKEDVCIILDNHGGKSAYANIIIKMINDDWQKFSLIGNRVFSSGFTIFTKATCKKYLIKDAIGAHHKGRFLNVDILTNGKPVWDCDIAQLSSKRVDEDTVPTDFMTETEFTKYNNGDDVFFNFERLCEIFPDAEII